MYQSAVTLYIYRVGWSVPIRSRNSYKSRVKIQLLTQIGHFGLVWPVSVPVWPPLDRSDRSDRGAGLPGGITSSSELQIGRSTYAFQSSRRHLCNGEVLLIIWQLCLDRSDWFIQHLWPVYPDCPANLLYANFVCQHMPPCFLVKLAYQETLLKAKIAPKQWKTPVHQSHLVSNEEGIQLTTCLDMPQDNSFTLLLIFLHLQWDVSLSTITLAISIWNPIQNHSHISKWLWLTRFQ